MGGTLTTEREKERARAEMRDPDGEDNRPARRSDSCHLITGQHYWGKHLRIVLGLETLAKRVRGLCKRFSLTALLTSYAQNQRDKCNTSLDTNCSRQAEQKGTWRGFGLPSSACSTQRSCGFARLRWGVATPHNWSLAAFFGAGLGLSRGLPTCQSHLWNHHHSNPSGERVAGVVCHC